MVSQKRDSVRRDPAIPPSDYGYWLSSKGRFYPVDGMKHIGFAAKYLKKPPGGEGFVNDDYRIDMLELGWTRVAMHSGRFVVQLPPKKVSAMVIRQVHRLVVEFHRRSELPISIEDNYTGLYAGGASVRPGDPRVMRQWHAIVSKRGAKVPPRPSGRKISAVP